ncbi:hypothetical protein N7466_010733 [Penicillium verhagenii]|uniref:uncharacterized protein n=1 Tax=Penicillium verhagenii TaxID=1562060 RepID=UPI0025450D04|nr:uncharacterized protein N7466_010733 [Penicillium verhagenii]KAJ5917179.1 hypothetical protein N7466_010733 [Penicillium verhagenii]
MRAPPSLLRQLTRGLPGPAPQRSFVTSARRLQVNYVNTLKQSNPALQPEAANSSLQDEALKTPELSREWYATRNGGSDLKPFTLEVTTPASAQETPLGISFAAPGVPEKSLEWAYLRDLCKCPQCVDRHSKQRSFRTNDIPANIRPRHVKWDGQHLEIQWATDTPGASPDHMSRWHHSYLLNPTINTHSLVPRSKRPTIWDRKSMNKLQHWVSYEDYLTDNSKMAASMRNLQRMGLIFIKDIPESREAVEKIATRMGPLRNSFYGMTWDVRTVPKAKNVAYTSQFLDFHMDLMYMNEPPGYQLLHCLQNSCEGGESLFADSFRIADIMKQDRPEMYNELTERTLGYEYVHEDQTYYNRRPVFELDEETKILRHVNYSPPFQSALPVDKNNSFLPLKHALDYFTEMLGRKENVFDLKLNPGECVIFDNRRIVHARRQFNTATGSRWLAGAYVDTDALLSRFAVTERKYPDVWRDTDPMIGTQN